MSKYTVTHRCGHEDTHQIFGPVKDRDRKAASLAKGDCGECYRAKQDAARKDAAQQAEVEAIGRGLKPLQGSEKQIAWAEQIRQGIAKQLDALQQMISRPNPRTPMTDAELAEIRDAARTLADEILSNTSASWWIDNQNKTYGPKWLLSEVEAKGLAPNFLAKYRAYVGFVQG